VIEIAAKHAADTGLQAWTVLGPLVGVVVGAVLGGLVQFFVTGRQEHHVRQRELANFRRQTYLEALDVMESLDREARRFVGSLSGRVEPDPDDQSLEAQWMRERDKEGGEAIQEVGNWSLELGRMLNRVLAVGDKTVGARMVETDQVVRDYIDLLGKQIGDGRFRGDSAREFGRNYLASKQAFVDAVRKDLEVDKLFKTDQANQAHPAASKK